MNRIVREHYPVARLPDDLRNELGDVEAVRITIESREDDRASIMSLLERAKVLRESGRIPTVSAEEAVARIRALRDE